MKILRVTLDRRLNFREHLRIQHKKIYFKTVTLRRIRRFVPAETVVKLYKAYILPHFQYCIPLLTTLAKTQCQQMGDVNKYVLRTMLEKSTSVPYEDLLMSAKTPSLLQRRTFQSLVLLYKCIFCNGPSHIKDPFEFRQSVYNLTGNGSILCQPRFNLSWKKQSFSYKLVMLWNKLPSSVRLSSSLKDFKSKLRSITF